MIPIKKNVRYRIVDGKRIEIPFASLPVRTECEHLGKRTEFRSGCGGRMCKHVCEFGHAFAVPGGNCQTCGDWEKR